jgi:hypothetical protein
MQSGGNSCPADWTDSIEFGYNHCRFDIKSIAGLNSTAEEDYAAT